MTYHADDPYDEVPEYLRKRRQQAAEKRANSEENGNEVPQIPENTRENGNEVPSLIWKVDDINAEPGERITEWPGQNGGPTLVGNATLKRDEEE